MRAVWTPTPSETSVRRINVAVVRSPAAVRQAHTHIRRRGYWHKGESSERGCRCTAAVVLLLYHTAVYCFCGCLAEHLLQKKNTAFLDRFVCL